MQHSCIRLCLLMTGSELMSGDTVDSNSALIGNVMADLGVPVIEKITVGDDADLLLQQLQRLSQHYDVIFMNGGLGPTQDDMTANVLAQAAGCALNTNKAAELHVHQWCETRGLHANPANLKQAQLPVTATIFPDAPGSAVAFYLMIGQCLVLATPGVPSELRHITSRQIVPFLQQRYALSHKRQWQQYQLFGIGESSLQQLIDEQFPQLAQHFIVGFRANFPYVELKLSTLDHSEAGQLLLNELLLQLDQYLLGPAHSTAASALIQALAQHGKTVSSAESCTGGLIASDITRIAGSSAVFPGSIVSYSNAMKTALLHVPESTLQQHGAVSEATVRAMLGGLLEVMHCDYGVAVSGIAGPDGGSPDKPVGTVWIAWGNAEQQQAVCLLIPLPRHDFQRIVSTIALDLLRRQVKGITQSARYLNRWQKH